MDNAKNWQLDLACQEHKPAGRKFGVLNVHRGEWLVLWDQVGFRTYGSSRLARVYRTLRGARCAASKVGKRFGADFVAVALN